MLQIISFHTISISFTNFHLDHQGHEFSQLQTCFELSAWHERNKARSHCQPVIQVHWWWMESWCNRTPVRFSLELLHRHFRCNSLEASCLKDIQKVSFHSLSAKKEKQVVVLELTFVALVSCPVAVSHRVFVLLRCHVLPVSPMCREVPRRNLQAT